MVFGIPDDQPQDVFVHSAIPIGFRMEFSYTLLRFFRDTLEPTSP